MPDSDVSLSTFQEDERCLVPPEKQLACIPVGGACTTASALRTQAVDRHR